jgi:hypothetical protein
LGIRIIWIKRNCRLQLLLGLFHLSSFAVEQAEIVVKMCALRAVSAQLERLRHLLECLRPVLCVGCFKSEIAELFHPVCDLLALLQRIEAALILGPLCVMQLVQGPRQVIEGLGMVWVCLYGCLPVLDGLGGFPSALEVLTEQVLRIRVVWSQRNDLTQQFGGTFHLIVLFFGKGQKIKRAGEIPLQAAGAL